MEFTDTQLNNFKTTWEKETNTKISNEKAQEFLECIVKLLIPVYGDKL